MNRPAGYSGTPLPKKLGLKDGQVVGFVGLPDGLKGLLTAREFANVETAESISSLSGKEFDYMHLFTKSAATVDAAIPEMRSSIKRDGMIWMSWPKKASKVATDVTEDVIRDRALRDAMVDVKVCAVDEVWSGLKLVIRKELRR